jgi:hypothetical protein
MGVTDRYREDGTPKPALLRLEEMIEDWTSRGEMTTDAAGRAVIRGYAGKYELRAEVGEHSAEITAAIEERGQVYATIVLRPSPPPGPRHPLRRLR